MRFPTRSAAALKLAAGAFIAAAVLAGAPQIAPRSVSGSGEEVEIVLKNGTVLQGTVLQELDRRIKIETPTQEVRSIDKEDIAEIRRAATTESRVVDILTGVERLLEGQEAILARLDRAGTEEAGAAGGAARAGSAERDDDRPRASGRSAPLTPAGVRSALGEPESIVADAFAGTAAAGPNPFPSEKWTYASGAGRVRGGERRAVYFVNGICVGSIVEVSGGAVRPDSAFHELLEKADSERR